MPLKILLKFFKIISHHPDISFHSLHDSNLIKARESFKRYEADVNILGKSVRNLHSSTVVLDGNSKKNSLFRLPYFPK